MTQSLREGPRPDQVTTADWLLSGLVAVNLALFVVMFVPAFSGIGGNGPGVADRLWGNYRLAGWRADVVWVCASTLVILRAAIGPARDRWISRLTSALCRVWIGCFAAYVGYALLHMFG